MVTWPAGDARVHALSFVHLFYMNRAPTRCREGAAAAAAAAAMMLAMVMLITVDDDNDALDGGD